MNIPLMAEAARRNIGAGQRCNLLTRRSVLWALTQHQRRDDGLIFASTETLAAESGVCARTVRRCLAEFEAECLVNRVGRRGHATAWRIDRAVLELYPLTAAHREVHSDSPSEADRGGRISGPGGPTPPPAIRTGGSANSDRAVRLSGPGGPTEEETLRTYRNHSPLTPQGGRAGSLRSKGMEGEGATIEPHSPAACLPEALSAGPSRSMQYGRTGAPEFSPPKRKYVLTEPEGFGELHSLWANADQLGGARSGRKSALRAYRRALERAEPQRILAAAREYLASPGVKREAGRYLMRLSRWLGEERWALAATPQVADGEVRRRLLCWQHEGEWLKAWGPAPDEPGGPEPLAVSHAMWERRVLGWWYRETDWPVRSWGPEPDRPGYQGPPIERPAGARPERG